MSRKGQRPELNTPHIAVGDVPSDKDALWPVVRLPISASSCGDCNMRLVYANQSFTYWEHGCVGALKKKSPA